MLYILIKTIFLISICWSEQILEHTSTEGGGIDCLSDGRKDLDEVVMVSTDLDDQAVKNETDEHDELQMIDEVETASNWIGSGGSENLINFEQNELVDKLEDDDNKLIWDLIQFLIMISPTNASLEFGSSSEKRKEITWWRILVEAVKCSMRHCNNGTRIKPKVMELPRITRRRRRDAYCRCEKELEKLIDQL